ncbi:MAG: hypothetical protein L6Q99_19435 [Planctomycetes bacterium]|nr:hypothetical protein [Planctomycetota bacterium]
MRLVSSLACCAPFAFGGESEFALVRIAEFTSGAGHGAEIVSVQSASARAVLLDADDAEVDVLELADATAPRRIARHALGLAPGEQATSVAIHPTEARFLVAVQGADRLGPGRLELRDVASGARLASFPCGVGPDSVVFDASGRFAAAACEGEAYAFDRATKTFRSPPGSVTWIDFGASPETEPRARTLELPAFDGVAGVVTANDARRIEREVDWNQNGKIDAELDFDGDGLVEDDDVSVGTYEGARVEANEKQGETFELPLPGAPASAVEPECLAFSPDASKLYVTLQEVNACAVVDVASGALVARFGFGVTEHAADVKKDGRVDFGGALVALREPDGLAVTPDGRFVVTADEGDTGPKAAKVKAPGRAGGGRTLTLHDAASGAVVGDTGDQLDRAAHAAGLYPDERSDNKGSEPEMLVVFAHASRTFAAVGLERAGGVALVDVSDPTKPRVLGVTGCGADPAASKKCEPEGLALYRRADGELFVLSANEGAGTLTVFALRRTAK